MDLNQFESKLAAVIGRPSNLRPFVCEGSPLDCDVFIVGYNPATDVPGDWWRFWRQGYGFQEAVWRPEYLASREDGEASRTRRKAEKIASAFPSSRFLICNIDSRPSKRQADMPKPVTRPFDTFLPLCRPKVILAHGNEAREHLANHPAVVGCRHLSRIPNADFDAVLSSLKQRLG
ncbi:hypothetical protein [Devosia enhydra]|uniref:hypothetical protein n=1 Tax=Devosia enhydra TaxID=665118 RepID=UPI0011602D2E|nr:hypothetical protein [Devosia enhydra]